MIHQLTGACFNDILRLQEHILLQSKIFWEIVHFFFAEIDPNQKSRDSDNNDEGKSDREHKIVDDLIDDLYQADSEDNAE